MLFQFSIFGDYSSISVSDWDKLKKMTKVFVDFDMMYNAKKEVSMEVNLQQGRSLKPKVIERPKYTSQDNSKIIDFFQDKINFIEKYIHGSNEEIKIPNFKEHVDEYLKKINEIYDINFKRLALNIEQAYYTDDSKEKNILKYINSQLTQYQDTKKLTGWRLAKRDNWENIEPSINIITSATEASSKQEWLNHKKDIVVMRYDINTDADNKDNLKNDVCSTFLDQAIKIYDNISQEVNNVLEC